MANYANLLATIAANIYTNGNNEVTAAMVKSACDSMVASLGAGYQFIGVAMPETNPGTPDQNVFYLASTAGTYTNFDGRVLGNGEIAILKYYNGTWYKETIGQFAKFDIYQTAKDLKDEGYIFAGVAIPNGTPNQSFNASTSIFYLVFTEGVYTNYGGHSVAKGEIAVLKRYSGNWYKETLGNVNSEILQDTFTASSRTTNCFTKILENGKTYRLLNIGPADITTIKSVVSNSYASNTIQLFQDGDIENTHAGESIDLEVTANSKYLGIYSTGALQFIIYEVGSVIDMIYTLADRISTIENGGSIVADNQEAIGGIISATNRMPSVYNKNNTQKCFAFVIGTDFHSDGVRFNRMCDFADKVDEITETFVLGDIIQLSNYTNLMNDVLNYNKPVIPLIGNHEVMSYGQVVGWDSSECMQNFYNENLVAHNGETHPSGKCYWYKDFSKTIDDVTKKLRVIGLFSFESDSEHNDITYYKQAQIDWLVDLLDGVDSNTMVMILTHYAVTPDMTKVECAFTPSDFLGITHEGGSNTYTGQNMSDNNFIPKIIQAWIDGTNVNASCTMLNDNSAISVNHTFANAHAKQFVGYVSGHSHYDFISRLTEYPKQIQFTLNCTSASDNQQMSDIGRKTSGKSQDCFTVIGIDWFNKRVNLIRVGADVTVDMRDRKYMNIELT